MNPIGKCYENKKIFQSLYGHTFDSLAFFKEYFQTEFAIFQTFCRRWLLKEEDLIKSIFLAILLHDIGKLTKTFQKNIKECKRTHYLPHPLAGLPVILEFKNYFPKLIDNIAPADLEIIAILSHHTQSYAGLYSNADVRLDFEADNVKFFIEEISTIHSKLGFREYFDINFSEVKINYLNRKPDELKNGIDYLKAIEGDKIAIKSVFCFIFNLLKISDILASINFVKKIKDLKNKKEGFIFDELYDSNNRLSFSGITNKMGKWYLKSKRGFQKNLYNNPKPFTMLFAPCGRGKTDASLFWATELIERKEANRIIFALPTQVTCNAMFDKLFSKDYFGESKVGLYHSRSFLELSEREKEQSKEEREEIDDHQSVTKDETFKGEIFFYPITVTTIDHLLYAFIHGYTKADFSLGNIQTSAIIFDEIHYYDNTMLSNLKQLFYILRRMKIPHLLMSGTFLEFLKTEINKANEYHWEEDEEGLDFTPFAIVKKQSSIVCEGVFDKKVESELITGYDKGLKQFVILNTIQSAQLTYIQLKKGFKKVGINEPNMRLLHSRYIYSDRRNLEREILRQVKADEQVQENDIPFILVATQVIEISLDISSHRLFTECAPIDAIGQRGGRLNRGGQVAGGNELIIFQTMNTKPYDEKLVEDTWTAIPEGIVSYLDFKKAADKIYGRRYIGLSNLEAIFQECTLFGRGPKEIRWNEDRGKIFKTREEKYQTIDVYPKELFFDLGDDLFKANKFSIKVPAWWYFYDIKEKSGLFCDHEYENTKYLLCSLPYSKELGLLTLNSSFVKIETKYPQII